MEFKVKAFIKISYLKQNSFKGLFQYSFQVVGETI